MKGEVTGGWSNEDLNNYYSSPSIAGVIKPRRMRWTRYVTHVGERRNVYKIYDG
jgi:hypothetical protein